MQTPALTHLVCTLLPVSDGTLDEGLELLELVQDKWGDAQTQDVVDTCGGVHLRIVTW